MRTAFFVLFGAMIGFSLGACGTSHSGGLSGGAGGQGGDDDWTGGNVGHGSSSSGSGNGSGSGSGSSSGGGGSGAGGSGGQGGSGFCRTCSELTASDFKSYTTGALLDFCSQGEDPNQLDAYQLFMALAACTCGTSPQGPCATACKTTACQGQNPSASCVMCLQSTSSGCGNQLESCSGDAP